VKSEQKRQSNRAYDQRRRQEKPWRKLYSTAQWRALRAAQLAKEPLCRRCSDRGQIVIATVAHHIKAHKGDMELFFDANNLASSCADCHDIDEQRIERGGKARQDIGADGWPL
jgi:5-methylcytosine-specific restriction endonuclease McrA